MRREARSPAQIQNGTADLLVPPEGALLHSDEFVAFLSEALPPIGLNPSAYRRRNIRRRITGRMESAGKPELALVATDVDPVSLDRAVAGSYPESSLREVPDGMRRKYFRREGSSFRIRESERRSVRFRKQDLLCDPPPGRFDLILCRNAAFTYFTPGKRLEVAGALAASLKQGGYLVIGRTENLPGETVDLF